MRVFFYTRLRAPMFRPQAVTGIFSGPGRCIGRGGNGPERLAAAVGDRARTERFPGERAVEA